jgi:hypothetical protein
MSINAYRLDELSNMYDNDDVHELNDPYLIHRLQTLLAAASKRGYRVLNERSVSNPTLNRRYSMDRRPGLLHLK